MSTDLHPATECTNCGAAGARVYCAECGEKQPGHHDLTVGHFTHEVVHELVHLDSKLFRTLRDLLIRPGKLTEAYFVGKKKRYIAPLRLFLTLFAIQFLAYSVYKPVAIYSLDTLMRIDPNQKLGAALERAAAKRKLPTEQLIERIEHRWQKNMSLFSMLGIVGLALMLKLLYLRRYLVEHLVFATHYLAFAYVMSLAIWPIYFFIGFKRGGLNMLLTAVTFCIACVYIYLAMRRFYRDSRGVTLVKTVVAGATNWGVAVLLMGGSLIAAILQVL